MACGSAGPDVSARTVGRVALVGYGLGGSVFHAPFIAADPRLDLACVVTANVERQRQAVARYSGVTVFARFEELLGQIDDVDLVVVSTPNATHVAFAEAVLRHSRPVVVDKPVAPSAGEVRHLTELAVAASTVVVPFHNRRWDGDFRTVRSLLGTGELGTLHAFESRYERWQPRVPSDPERAWKRDASPSAATGIVHDLGTHLVDQAVVLFGRPDAVYAEVACRRPTAEVNDDAFIALRYANGPRVHLWATAVAADQGPRFRLLGSAGTYTKAGMDVQEAALIAGRLPSEQSWGEEPVPSWGRINTGAESREVRTLAGDYGLFYAGIAAFLLDGAPPPVDIPDALLTAEIIEAALRSAHTGAVIPLA
jgi:scyllo-inositol 2-dehydrogenase (NADP+)